MNKKNKNWENQFSFLLSCFSGPSTLEETATRLGEFLTEQMPVQSLVLIRMEEIGRASCREIGIWDGREEKMGALLAAAAQEHMVPLVQELEAGKHIWDAELLKRLELREQAEVWQFPICFEQNLSGILLLLTEPGEWKEEKNSILDFISNLIGILFAYHTSIEKEALSSFVFNTVLDGMKASIYISDPDTDRILFMNQTMKETFGLEHPEGMICWKVLQKGMTDRCPFCPVEELKRRQLEAPVIQWEENNTVNGRMYNNYDSLISWVDGRIVHLQQSIDTTALKSANTDELTQMMTRRPGKEAMQQTLRQAQEAGRTMTVCMYDINRLKEVNDRFGHAEGDKLISVVSDAVRDMLQKEEYAFRLSGDEFIILFKGGQKSARERLEQVRRDLRSRQTEYDISFCYGLVEVAAGYQITEEEALFLADERMYEQKRRYHILSNEHRRMEKSKGEFDYNKELLYDALVQSTDDYIYICNMKTGVFQYTKEMVEEFELPEQVIENAAAVWGARVHKSDRPAFLEANQLIADGRAAVHCVEYRARNRKGEWVWVRCRGHLEFDENGEPELFAGFITNLGKKNRIDHLTGLYNKLEFEETIHYMIEQDAGHGFGMMALGIDDLKHVNDLYNRVFGDEVIRVTAQKLQTLLPGAASLYRLDGDEFGILVRGADRDDIRFEMEKIYRAISQAFEVQQEYNGNRYYSSLSAGCLSYPDDAGNYLDLVKYAGYCLEYSKNHGKKRCTFFSDGILNHRARTLEMVEELRESIDNDFRGFSLQFQPLVHADNGSLNGVEALARWESKRFGKVSPMEFIPLLEQTSLIVPFGKWALMTAMHICQPWTEHFPDIVVHVNLSFLQIQEPDFILFVKKELKRAHFPAGNLVLELTESFFAGENKRVQEVFQKMRSLGVRIAMDDFGTGYSTLGILKEVPADIVKIDKTFVRDIQKSNFDATFIQFVVALCHDVGIKVCLEGVETEEEYRMVSLMGLDIIQGFLFAKPQTEQEFIERYILGSQ